MSGRFFLDTNVFVYSFDSAAPMKARRARELIREAVATRKGIVSYQVVQESFNVALRRFTQPMTVPEAEQYLATVFRPLIARFMKQVARRRGWEFSALRPYCPNSSKYRPTVSIPR
jgi:predicted nucleic acid-binding protein